MSLIEKTKEQTADKRRQQIKKESFIGKDIMKVHIKNLEKQLAKSNEIIELFLFSPDDNEKIAREVIRKQERSKTAKAIFDEELFKKKFTKIELESLQKKYGVIR